VRTVSWKRNLSATSGTTTTISLSAVSCGPGGVVGSRSVVAGGHVIGSTIGAKSIARGSISLGSYLVILAVQVLGLGTIKVEPPVTDEVVLVEDGAVGTEEGVFAQTSETISGTDVEYLAFGLGISVVASINLTLAREASLRSFSVDGIVLAWDTGNAGLQHVKSWVTSGCVFGLSTGIAVKWGWGIGGTIVGRWGVLTTSTSAGSGTTTASAVATVTESVRGNSQGKG